ncbi:MAG TPA: xanthine phosphoribosyltransferase [Trueperaceae bacterium]|nr:xanthine phosphoribosyltransferase [Trueperaceae bacterium]
MTELVERIKHGGSYLGNGILKVDSFLNHRLEPKLSLAFGEHFKAKFDTLGVKAVNKIITAETSGIAPALATAIYYDKELIYARKKKPVTMLEHYSAQAPSHTKGGITTLMISKEFIGKNDNVLIIDDFLASGKTLFALAQVVKQSGANLLGIGCVIEKSFENGRELLAELKVPIVSLAIIDSLDENGITVRSG